MRHLSPLCAVGFLIAPLLGIASPAGGELTGKVLNADGSPARSAVVYLLVDSNVSNPADPPAATTDDSGAFRFEKAPEVENGIVLGTGANDGAMGFARFSAQRTPEIRLPEATVELTVPLLDPTDKPAADVPVRIRVLGGAQRGAATVFNNIGLPALIHPPFGGKTDSAGAVTFRGLPQGGSLQLDVVDDRYAQLTWENRILLPAKSKARAEPIKLKSAANISGRIKFGPTGKPAAGVRVGAQAEQTGGWGEAITDGEGVYHMRRLGAGRFNAALDLKGELANAWTARAVEGLDLSAGQNKEGVDFTLIEGALISGRVIGEAGEGIPDVPIGVYGPAHPRSGGWVQGGSTSADGSFSHRVPGGEQYIYIQTAQPPKGYQMPAQESQTITVEDGKTAKIEFLLRKALPVSVVMGKVVGPDGAPAAGASIDVLSDQQRFMGGINGAVSAADGSFEVNAPTDRNTIRLRARKGELATRSMTLIKRGQQQVELKLEANALASFVGRVVDERTQPVGGASISLTEMTGMFGFGREIGLSDDDGKFHVDQLFADGNYSISVTMKGYGQTQSAARLSLQPGKQTTLPDLVLRKRDAVVAGILLDEDGNPVSGQRVQISGKTSGANVVTTNSEGKFRDEVVAGEDFSIYVSLKDGRTITKTAKSGDDHIVLDPMTDAKPAR